MNRFDIYSWFCFVVCVALTSYFYPVWGLSVAGLYIFVFTVVTGLRLFYWGENYIDEHNHKRQLREIEQQAERAKIQAINAESHYVWERKGLTAGERKPEETAPEAPAYVPSYPDLSHAIFTRPKPDLINEIKGYQRVIIVGGMDSGKTTNMLWLARAKQEMSWRTLAIDTHASPRKWPVGIDVAGFGRDHSQAKKIFDGVIDLMDRRFREIGMGKVGERGHKLVNVFSDEWSTLPDYIPDFETTVKLLLTESRKASIDLTLAVHDLTTNMLGTKGKAKLKEAFDAVVHCNKIGDTSWSTRLQIGWGDSAKMYDCHAPGRYTETGPMMLAEGWDDYINLKTVNGIDTKDLRALEAMQIVADRDYYMVDPDLVRRYMGKSKGGGTTKAIGQIAERYNVPMG